MSPNITLRDGVKLGNIIGMEKQCTKCHQVKPLDAYNKQSRGKYGHAATCRDCAKAEQAEYRRENPDKVRAAKIKWEENNPGKALESKRKWQQENPGKASEYTKRWAEKNPERHRANIDRLQKKYQEESSKTASNTGKPWTEEDYQTLMRDDISVMEISKLLGRTYATTQVKRSVYGERLKRLAIVEEVHKRMAR